MNEGNKANEERVKKNKNRETKYIPENYHKKLKYPNEDVCHFNHRAEDKTQFFRVRVVNWSKS